MATPAAILSILVKAEGIAGVSRSLTAVNEGLVTTNVQGAKAEKRLLSVGAAGKVAGTGIASAAKHAAGFAAAYAGFRGVEKSIHTTEELGKSALMLSRNFGLAADEASRWAAVAKARGIEGKQLSMGFKTLSTQVHAAGENSKQAVKTFQDLGVSQKDLKAAGGDLSQVLGLVSDGLAAMPGGTEKAALQSRLFGRTWLQLSPLIRDGSAAMHDQLKVADEYGATLGGKGVKAIQDSIKAQREAKLASIGLQVTIGTTLIPVIDKVVEGFAHWVKAFREGTGTAGLFRNAIQAVLDKLQPFGQSVQQIVGFLKQHQQIAQPLIGVILSLAAAQVVLNAALEANPVVQVVTVLALLTTALVTAYRESQTFRNVVDSTFQWLQGALAAIATASTAAFSALRNGFQAAAATVTSATQAVVGEISQWDTLWSAIGRGATIMVSIVKLQLAALQVAFRAGMLVLAPIATAAWKLVQGVFSGAWTALKALVTGGLTAIRGVIQVFGGLFKGDFSQMWDGVKTIFRGAIKALSGILDGAWKILKAPVEAIGAGLHDAFSNSWDRIKGLFRDSINAVIDFLNVLISAVNAIPGVPDIGKIGKIGGGGGGGGNRPKQENLGQTGHLATGGSWGRGGMVNTPTVIMGEEAPRWPEFVIPTNPQYRKRAQGLLGQAMQQVGFASGGVYSQGQIMDLWTGQHGASQRRLIASAVAMAESGGRASATSANPAGGSNLGLWQIWSGNPGATLDPAGNARAAINLSKNGANWGLWETFVNGAYKKFMGKGRAGGGPAASGLSFDDIIGQFPHVSDAMGMFGGLGKYVLAKAGAYVKKKVGDLFTGGPGAGSKNASGISLKILDAIRFAQGMGFAYPSAGQLTGGGHVQGSFHYQGRAVDFGTAGHSSDQMMALWRALYDKYGLGINELFYDPAGRYIDNHKWVNGAIGGHSDHIHLAFKRGGVRRDERLPFLGSFRKGGVTGKEGMAHLHKNEAVLPLAKGGKTVNRTGPAAGGSHGGGTVIRFPVPSKFPTLGPSKGVPIGGYPAPADAGASEDAVNENTAAAQALADAIDRQNEAIAQQNEIIAQQMELEGRIAENQQKILALANQGPAIIAATVAAVSGGIGGKVGLGFQSPSYPSGMARYK